MLITNPQPWCVVDLEEASDSCGATLVPVHAGHAASGLDVGAAGVVGDALQKTKAARSVGSRHTQTRAQRKRSKSLSPFPPAEVSSGWALRHSTAI